MTFSQECTLERENVFLERLEFQTHDDDDDESDNDDDDDERVCPYTKALDTKALTAQTLKEKGRNIGKAEREMPYDDDDDDDVEDDDDEENDYDLYVRRLCLLHKFIASFSVSGISLAAQNIVGISCRDI